ncbi:NUDIX domain-containing protein [Stenotrophomonas sp. CC22-02]|uniref:NUDIX domain-containing protein n=1 Tax=Stenotrophomonas sp. CC22-02 TaxID=1378087 RepID=UPI00106322E5|nr:NUDIX domain-containing protein [Stenotrophomonas sp. CC22-02]TDV30874.1 NUDIX domain-containing protein [Stenotrophomonas sp. CC22-02]
MPQSVYAAVRSGTQWLIAQKRTTNNWWSAYATPVLVMEAAALLNAALTSADRAAQTDSAIALLANAETAARTAWSTVVANAPAIAAVATAAGQVQTARGLNTVEALQAAIPYVLTAVDRASLAAGFAARVALSVPPIAAWPDAGLGARIAGAQAALETWTAERPAVTVNQAGQWALPGGAKGAAEAAEVAARREFAEETGMALDAGYVMEHTVAFSSQPGEVLFYLVCFTAPAEVDLATLATTLNQQLAPRPAWMRRPASDSIVDWELSRMQRVEQAEISSLLGVRQPVDPPPGGPAHRQSIDWYAAIARYIEGLPAD